MEIPAIRDLAAKDMRSVNDLILKRLGSDVVLINQIGAHIVHGGGKRLRPMIVLLAARAMGYAGERHIDLAAIIEFIHTATLLHDDVVDASDKRRNHDTANALWGNAASVLTGDFLYSRAFEMMVDVDSMRVMQILATATNRIAEGEVLQLLNCNNPDTSEREYREVILRKTAVLFEAGSRLGAVIAGGSPEQEEVMADYGLHLGIAFQLVDDALDYTAKAEDLGKNLGDDLAEGKPTLPLIHAMQKGTEAQRTLIRQAIEEGGRDKIDEIHGIIESTGAIAYTARLAQEEAGLAKQAISKITASPYRDALASLAGYSVSRTY
ncbi:MAG: octaprenyl diphosphate synthase [Gammaproteobacteria bacterium]|nr:octaprenyl diphosphate synthase [Gammaproteobacteria bacterium]MBU1653764.1 octaprenyl diphosphate synthase [Gammaproteobacteria bacterium]MBU1962687.1 octaprenyl diphosphate synthase [Gammaproteobacteria bacterium]